MRRIWFGIVLAASSLSLGCADDVPPVGSSETGSDTSTETSTGDGDGDPTGDGDGDATGDGDGDATGDGDGDPTGDGDGDPTGDGDGDPTGDGDGDPTGDGDGDGDGGNQPDEGPYSHCLAPGECGGDPLLCLGIQEDGMTVDGFCSIPCAIDENCPASPGGTAEPLCMDIGGDGWCALECENETCPGGMECIATNMGNGPSICF